MENFTETLTTTSLSFAVVEAAAASVTPDTLSKVWDELGYRLDVCRVTKGARIEHL